MPEKIMIGLYHKHCVDGTAAAAVVLKKFPQAKMIPLAFDTAVTDLELAKSALTPEAKVIFVDTAIGLEEIADQASEVLVIDHHISEKDRIEKLAQVNPNITYVFDNNESGATLAFKHFFPAEELPLFLSYVRDIDLWKNELLPESNWFQQYLSMQRNQPELLSSLFSPDVNLEENLKLGKVLSHFVSQEVEVSTKIDPQYLTISGHKVPAFNITNHQSKAGNILSAKLNSVVIMYTILGDKTRLSIRSTPGCNPTALAIAESFGGGGHEQAAGGTVYTKSFFDLLLA
jgi:oligoribonuclease NrnB/cAMP/cGMP phosphodiesterase (DHH superfamily)